MPKGVKALGIVFASLSIFPLIIGIALVVPGALSKQNIDFLSSINIKTLRLAGPSEYYSLSWA